MSTVRFNIEKDTARPRLAALRRGLADRRSLNRAGAEGMLPPVQRSLRAMARSNHNPFGVHSTFWNLMVAGTHAGVDDEGGFVAMPRPVALRRFGGTVRPKTTTFLAIPAREEAYGKSPKDFNDLRFVLLPNGRFGAGGALIQTDLQAGQKTRGKKRDAEGRGSIAPRELGGLVYYWLVQQATIAPDPEVLPTNEELGAGASRGVKAYVRAIAKGQGGTP